MDGSAGHRGWPVIAVGEPLYAFIRRHLDHAGRLPDSGLALPDEDPDTELRWAPGAEDGALSHHVEGDPSGRARARSLAPLVIEAAEEPSTSRLAALSEAASSVDALGVVDALLDELRDRRASAAGVRRVGAWLAETSAHRNAVKIGIALLGGSGGVAENLDVLRVLGAHDEFTLYAAVALGNGLQDPDSELWALAAGVDGWGRIQCVERLRGTADPQIRRWILREGFRNSIMYEYLAFIAAETGGLLAALTEPEVDRDLLTAAGEILSALIEGGPAEDIGDYPDGPDAVEAYLGWMRRRADTLGDFLVVADIHDLVTSDQWHGYARHGWTTSRCAAFAATCTAILDQPEWPDRVTAGLRAERQEFWRARRAAERLGIDTFEISVARIRADPFGMDWFDAWRLADPGRAERLAALASELLPLAEIGSGLGEALGLGPGWEAHGALDRTLQALDRHPGLGGELLLVALRSPVTRNRNMALRALEAWPVAQWPPGAVEAIAHLAELDPNEGAREFAARVLELSRSA